jgi:hypothetical protein
MVTMLFATIFLIRSIVVTKRPTLEKWETYRLEKSRDSGLLTRIFNQLKSVVNALSFVLFLLINLVWKTVVRFTLWLGLVVTGMISEISKSIRDMCFVETILKPGVTFGVVVLLSVAVREFTQPIRGFLANQEGIAFFLDEKNWVLFELFILFILSLFAIIFLAWIWKGLDDELTEKAIVSALVIAVIWAFVSFLTWMLAPLNVFGLKSYRPGIYLAAVITILVIAVAILGISKLVGFIFFKSNKSGSR